MSKHHHHSHYRCHEERSEASCCDRHGRHRRHYGHGHGSCDCGEHGYGYGNCAPHSKKSACDCGGHGHSIIRRYPSPAEQRAVLEEYIEQLKQELAGAEAALKRLTPAE